MLTELIAQELLQVISLPDIRLVKHYNHVYQIRYGNDIFFLKTYTKDWYGGDIAGTAYCVDHERTAWEVLANKGLNVPKIVLAEESMSNPLGRPFLLMRALEGQSFVNYLSPQNTTALPQMLAAIGCYMRTMHEIEFEFAGYIVTDGLKTPPDPNAWQHFIWTFGQLERDAIQTWQEDKESVSPEVMNAIESYYVQHKHLLMDVYQKARFTHGDCHASAFFLQNKNHDWQISGILDMEVASAGNIYFDFLKFGLEIAAYLPVESHWWDYLFEAYGSEPAFELMKLMFLAVNHHNYSWRWQCPRENLLKHFVSAEDWTTLWDFQRIAKIIPQ